MRAEILDNGTLQVSAETGLESFALKAWSDGYFATDNVYKPVTTTLLISIKVEASPAKSTNPDDCAAAVRAMKGRE